MSTRPNNRFSDIVLGLQNSRSMTGHSGADAAVGRLKLVRDFGEDVRDYKDADRRLAYAQYLASHLRPKP